jgi:RND family efflux transporter MFP subunit
LPEIQVQTAQSELDAARALCDELQGREPRLKREVEGQRQRRDALRKRLELKTEETRQLTEAEANVKVAEARLRQARTAVNVAKLRLSRMTVRAPLDGRVLSLIARPGSRLMGLATGTAQDASTVLSLYDQARLQVRADVRLEDVPRVRHGQPVKIETPAAPGAGLDGEVLFTTHQADIQKNTLQDKVAIKDPPATIRPDMLVQVTFLAPPTPKIDSPEEAPLRLLVARQLVESSEGGSRVWIADQAAGVARLRSVKLGAAAGDWVEVTEGLNAADRIISSGREGLREGERITVTGEDTAGIVSSGPGAKRTAPTRLRRTADGGDANKRENK